MEDQKLRELCISHAVSIILNNKDLRISLSLSPVYLADEIFKYIKTGELCDRLRGLNDRVSDR